MRILVVEDDVALASYLRKGLESDSHGLDVALDGSKAHSMAAAMLIMTSSFSDLNLPKLDGLSAM